MQGHYLVYFSAKYEKNKQKFAYIKKKLYFCSRNKKTPLNGGPRKVLSLGKGEMLEWLKRHAWKACKRQKRFLGSNPCLSAIGRLASLLPLAERQGR